MTTPTLKEQHEYALRILRELDQTFGPMIDRGEKMKGDHAKEAITLFIVNRVRPLLALQRKLP